MKKLVLTAFCVLITVTANWVSAEDGDPVTKTLVWPDGTRYVGGVVDGKRSGKGTIFWQDGTRFVGQFDNDMRNGPGTMILPDGTVYTGFFKDDELVDTQATIAASNADQSVALDEEETAAALEDTELPMEADSLSAAPDSSGDTDSTQIADATDNTDEGSSFVEPDYGESDPYSEEVTEVTEEIKDQLIETIDLWAAAWSDQNVVQYLDNYSDDFAVPGNQSRRTWEALRRTRLNRPSYINLDVTYQRFELVETNIVDVFFRQAYRSNTYSDLTDKVVRMQKEDTNWRIIVERSR